MLLLLLFLLLLLLVLLLVLLLLLYGQAPQAAIRAGTPAWQGQWLPRRRQRFRGTESTEMGFVSLRVHVPI